MDRIYCAFECPAKLLLRCRIHLADRRDVTSSDEENSSGVAISSISSNVCLSTAVEWANKPHVVEQYAYAKANDVF